MPVASWDEADEAFHDAFARAKGVSISQESIDALNQKSMGQPYLMQLLGFYLVGRLNQMPSKPVEVSPTHLEEVAQLAQTAYERRALQPLLCELEDVEIGYLRAMSAVLGEDRIASTADICHTLGKAPQQLSKTRACLIDYGYIASPAYGKLVFCVPYLADYVMKPSESASALEVIRQRRV